MDYVAQLIAASVSTRGHRAHFCQTLGMTPMLPADASLKEDKITTITVPLQIILGEMLATI